MGCCANREYKTMQNKTENIVPKISIERSAKKDKRLNKGRSTVSTKDSTEKDSTQSKSISKFDSIARKEFDRLDLDGDGKLDFYELHQLMTELAMCSNQTILEEKDVKNIFQQLDTDNDNYVQYEEFKILVCSIISNNLPNFENVTTNQS